MSVRYRYGSWRIRKVVKDENGKRHWLERGPYRTKEEALLCEPYVHFTYIPTPEFKITEDMVKAIFQMYPPSSPYYVPLILGYKYGVPLEDAYKVSERDLDGDTLKVSGRIIELDYEAARGLKRRISMLIDIRMQLRHKTYDRLYLVVDNLTGKRLSIYSMTNVQKKIRKTICPGWTFDKFRKNFISHNEITQKGE